MTELHPKAKDLLRLAKSTPAAGNGASGNGGSGNGGSGNGASERASSPQEPSPEELRAVMEGFQRRVGERSLASVSRLNGKRRGGRYETSIPKDRLNRAHAPFPWFEGFVHHYRRGLLKWSLLTAIMTGSLGALANWGVPQWREDLGQLADRVGESLDDLVVRVTGRERPFKTATRSRMPEAEQTLGVASHTAPHVIVSHTPPDAPDAIAALQPRSSSEATPARFAAPEPTNFVPKSNGADAQRASVGSNTAGSNTAGSNTVASNIGANNAENAASAVPDVAVSPDANSTTARGPSAFSEAEVNLIAAARSALASGNYAQTRRLLDEHRTTFPTGALSEERETLRALVACRESGNTALAQRYVARRPQSLFAPRLIRECGLSTAAPPTPMEPPNHSP